MMATSEERMKILQMVQEGKISADDGAKLLAALSEGTKNAAGSRLAKLRVAKCASK